MPREVERAFEKEYTGKKVPKKYQGEYGKRYSKKEADIIFFKFRNKHKKK